MPPEPLAAAPPAAARIGIFGGSFDPPHLGHVAVARAAADAFVLDTVLFTPTGRQPLKSGGAAARFPDRLAMLQLLAPVDPRLTVSDLDGPRPDGAPNYTVDLLRRMRETLPQATLFAISGADSFLELRRWREPTALLALAEWIVVSRPGFPLADLAPLHLTPAERQRIHLLETVHEDVSATAVRAALAGGASARGVLDPAVTRYIHEHGLYQA